MDKERIAECEACVDLVTSQFNQLNTVILDLVDFYSGTQPQIVAVAVFLKVQEWKKKKREYTKNKNSNLVDMQDLENHYQQLMKLVTSIYDRIKVFHSL